MKTLDQPKYVPKVSFLADEGILKDYQERIKSCSKRAKKFLNIFTYDNGLIKGSNSSANVALASLFPQEYRLALPSQVLHDSELNPEFFRGNYEDLGLVLRTNGDDSSKNNNHDAKKLYEQLKKRGITPSEENPVMISLRGLGLEADKSHYGLMHKLTDETEIVQAPELSYKNNEREFSRTDERGIPIFDKDGTRTFYARKDGLDGFCLWGLVLDSDWFWFWYWALDDSGADGKVVVAKNYSKE